MSDIEKVKKLREITGAGFKDCSAALEESGGDIEKSIEILRIKGISKASKKMSRLANEGVIVISEDNNVEKKLNKLEESDKKKIKKLLKKMSIKSIINEINKDKKISKKTIYGYYLKLKNEKK